MRNLIIKTSTGEHEYRIPSSWKEVTLEQLLKLDFEVQSLQDHLSLLAVFTELPLSEIENTPSNLWSPLLEAMQWSKNFPDWNNLPVPYTITINHKTYEIPRKLELTTFGQKIYAAQAISKDKSTAILEVLACYLQPLIHGKTDLERIEEVKETVKHLPAIQTVPIGRFFFLKLIASKRYGKLGLTLFKLTRAIKQSMNQWEGQGYSKTSLI